MTNEKEINDKLESLLTPPPITEILENDNTDSNYITESRSKILKCLDTVIDKLCMNEGISKERIESGQKGVVTMALNAYIKGVKNVIIEAPTGTGKSIIGLLITESINLYNGNITSAYTLTPTKILQDQLDDDNKRLKLGWALLKGQNNYICLENNKSFGERACGKLAISKATKLECAKTCEYIIKRHEAIISHNSVLSYAYWLSAMNYTYNTLGDNAPFHPREVTVFDECHLITDTVQGLFKVEISNAIKDRIIKLITFYESVEADFEKKDLMIKHTENFKECFDVLFKITTTGSLKSVYDSLLMTTAYIKRISDMFMDFMQTYFPKNENLWSVGQQEFDKNFERFHSMFSNMRFFLMNNKDIENIVADKDINEDGSIVLSFRTLNESDIMNRHVHKFTNFAVWTSATLGGDKGLRNWAEHNSITDYEYCIMESDFEFNDSPISICAPMISMSMKDKSNNMGAMMQRIMAICAMHPTERGIIHTGNFEISRNLESRPEEISKRFIFYKNSFEKAEAIERLKESENGIIVGPSLSEGLDLKDDLSRFSIIAKVPYPSLGDSLNKLKLERIAGWYDWQTTVTIMQQLGRHIRHKKDWGKTYLLDSSFDRVLKNSTFPEYISNRFNKINIKKLIDKFQESEYEDLLGDY